MNIFTAFTIAGYLISSVLVPAATTAVPAPVSVEVVNDNDSTPPPTCAICLSPLLGSEEDPVTESFVQLHCHGGHCFHCSCIASVAAASGQISAVQLGQVPGEYVCVDLQYKMNCPLCRAGCDLIVRQMVPMDVGPLNDQNANIVTGTIVQEGSGNRGRRLRRRGAEVSRAFRCLTIPAVSAFFASLIWSKCKHAPVSVCSVILAFGLPMSLSSAGLGRNCVNKVLKIPLRVGRVLHKASLLAIRRRRQESLTASGTGIRFMNSDTE